MRYFLFLLTLLASASTGSAPITLEQVPEPLRPWADWVLDQHPELDCPVRFDQTLRECVWPGRLQLDLHDRGGEFSQQLRVFRAARVQLPGNLRHWPEDVMIDGEPASLLQRQGLPVLAVQAGEHRITGRFRWSRLPDTLNINPGSGIIDYRLRGETVPLPRIRDDKLWLLTNPAETASKAPEDRLRLDVYRLLQDGHPFQLVTQLDLEVSGSQRELVLGKPLPDAFIPLTITGDLPAGLEPDGQLRMQLRPGRWTLRITARHPGELLQLGMQAQPAPWPEREIWAFRASHLDRLVEIEGVPQIDPRQTRLPADWANLPTFQLAPDAILAFKPVRRGDPQPEPDRLELQRDMWLDFDGQGFSLQDRIQGVMTHDWRLAIDPEFALTRVSSHGQPQFITRLPQQQRAGFEVRRGHLDLLAESRLPDNQGQLPATGWGKAFQRVTTRLHLPPGWRLLDASGADGVSASWLRQWTLYDLFLVMIATLATGKLWGWRWSAPALAALALSWHLPEAPQLTWLYLLAAAALLRLVPPQSSLFTWVRNARRLGLAVLLLIALPFFAQQVRDGLYPQLEMPWLTPQTLLNDNAAPKVAAEPAPAAAVAEQALEKGAAVARRSDAYFDYSRSAPAKPTLQQLDPNAQIQTGAGLPGWRWRTSELTWNGPVTPDQNLRLYLLDPRLHLVLRLVTLALLLVLAWRLLDLPWRAKNWRQSATSLGLCAIALGLFGAEPRPAVATGFPSPELLQELEQRLTENSEVPPYADIGLLRLQVVDSQLQAELQVHAIRETAIPLPVDMAQMQPGRVRVNDQDSSDRLLLADRLLWLQIPAGHHKVLFQARLAALEQIQIPLPLRPHHVEFESGDWSLEGVDSNRVPDQQLSLTRARSQRQTPGQELTSSALPAFLRVERTLRLGIHWEVETQVTRISPTGSALSVSIPVLPGAAVVSEGLRVKDGRVLVNMAANQTRSGWRSRLDPSSGLTLTAADDSRWLEAWQADISPIWHARISGIPPIHHQDGNNNWLPRWHPWPGEQVTLDISRPMGVQGQTLTIDDSRLLVRPGDRASDMQLTFRLRASQGGQHDLQLPEGAQLQSVKIDGRSQPIRQDGRLLSLPLVPGEQQLQIDWRSEQGIAGIWQTPSFRIGIAGANALLSVEIPHNRWVLWLQGPLLGPAVLFWGQLLVLLMLAAGLARLSAGRMPLGFASWLLLGIGLTQVSLLSGLLVVAWFFLLDYRGRLDEQTEHGRFAAIQALLVLVTIGALGVLLWAIQQGLLGAPEMQIRGFGSNSYQLHWYQDRIGESYPQARIWSASLWVYRALMLAWSLWLAFSLLRWLQWGWQCFSRHGLWRSFVLLPGVNLKGLGAMHVRKPRPKDNPE